jgi:hypothetical protein
MFDFFAELGTFFSGVGTSIMNGLRGIGDFLSTNIVTPLSEFVSNIPTMISEGWTWLTDKVGALWSGDSGAGIASSGLETVSTAPAATSEFVVNAPTQTGMYSPTDMMSVGAVAPQAAPKLTPSVTSGLMGSSATTTSESFIPKAMKFLSSPVGQVVSKGAVAGVTTLVKQREQRKLMKDIEKEQRRQEAEARRDWLMQQQYESEVGKWQATRQNEVARANAQNQWAGASGVWMNPTTDVPTPSGV